MSGLLITRPADRSDALCRMARERGWQPLLLPLFRIVPEQSPAVLAEALAGHASADWWIFTSTAAVDLVARAAPAQWAPTAAIGAATAARLSEVGRAPTAVPEDRFDSEALLALPAFQQVSGHSIVLLGNASGRDALQRELSARGAEVHFVAVYRLESEQHAPDAVAQAVRAVDVVLLTSGRGTQALWDACPADCRSRLAQLPIVVPSARVAGLAAACGMQGPHVVAQPMSDLALLEAADTLRAMEDKTKAPAESPETERPDQASGSKDTAVDASTDAAADGADDKARLVETPPAGQAAPKAGDAGGPSSPPPPVTPRRERRGGTLLLWLLLLVLIGAVGAGAYWGWERLEAQQERLRVIDSRVTERLQQLETVAGDAERARTLAERAAASAAELEQGLDAVQSDVGELRRAIDAGRVRTQALAAEQLLMQANERLLLGRDVSGARTALRLADRRLASLDDPRFFPVREAIADEQMALGEVAAVDRTALALRLSTLIRRADRLPLRGGVAEPTAPEPTLQAVGDDAAAGAGFWARVGSALQEALASVFVVRRTDEPIQPLLAPEQQGLVRGVLMLRLESARLALLAEDQGGYEEGLRASANWLEAQFAIGDEAVDNAVSELRSLRREQLVPALPDISGSLTRLRDILQRLDGENG